MNVKKKLNDRIFNIVVYAIMIMLLFVCFYPFPVAHDIGDFDAVSACFDTDLGISSAEVPESDHAVVVPIRVGIT